jgi:hypothetical protein
VGASARAAMGPGCIDKESWDRLTAAFANVCSLYGNHEPRFELGRSIDAARAEWFEAPAKARARLGR